ncbi:MAG: hypothetical protein GX640_03955, partial [Fibrobacter sp.]|nr:hypothetical protein [Fibrobacter sp.]
MERHPQSSRLFDTRAYLYRAITQILIILGAGILIKFAVFDIITIQSEQMEPSILNGDRILIFKTLYIFPFK